MLSKTLGHYLNDLRYDPNKVLHDLDEEIQVNKSETELHKQAKAEEVKVFMQKISLSKEEFSSMQEASKKLPQL